MHQHTPAEAAILDSTQFGIYTQVFIMSGPQGQESVTGEDLPGILGYDPMRSCRISADLDQPVVSADLRFDLGQGSQNLSPLYSSGPQKNNRPVFDPGQYLDIRAKCAPGSPPSAANPSGSADWAAVPFRPCFTGRIDSADPAEDQDDILVVRCRDIYSDLLETWIEPGPLGGWPMQGANIDQHLRDLLLQCDESQFPAVIPPGGGSLGITNFDQLNIRLIGSSPQFMLPKTVQPGPLLTIMRDAVLQSGWDLRGKYDSADLYKLTLYEPNRTLANPYVIPPSRYFELSGLSKDRTGVRNVVEVTPADPPRASIKQFDVISINKYGRRYIGISEDFTSNIRNPTQGLALNDAILSDLKEPKVGGVVRLRFHPFIEINDVIQLPPNNVHHDQDLVLAVSGYEHDLMADGHGETTLRTRSIPAAAYNEWLSKQSPRMRYVSSDPPSGTAAEGATWDQY